MYLQPCCSIPEIVATSIRKVLLRTPIGLVPLQDMRCIVQRPPERCYRPQSPDPAAWAHLSQTTEPTNLKASDHACIGFDLDSTYFLNPAVIPSMTTLSLNHTRTRGELLIKRTQRSPRDRTVPDRCSSHVKASPRLPTLATALSSRLALPLVSLFGRSEIGQGREEKHR